MAYKAKRGKPYIWVTWITKVAAGEDHCYLQPWFKAHYDYDKIEESEESKAKLAQWNKDHDALVLRYAEHMRKGNLEVTLEDQNAFKLEGPTWVLAGKPDMVIRDTLGRTVVDGKSGKKRESDHYQVRIYLVALPKTLYSGELAQSTDTLPLAGRVLYKEMLHDVKLTQEHRTRLNEVLKIVSSPKAPKAVPSRWECSRCNIADCTFRFKGPAEGTTDEL